jgi:hypothetical protein
MPMLGLLRDGFIKCAIAMGGEAVGIGRDARIWIKCFDAFTVLSNVKFVDLEFIGNGYL